MKNSQKLVKLGKQSPRHDRRTLQFANYVQSTVLPIAPQTYDWGKNVTVDWGMMKNDTIGDCTCAAAGHLIMEWSADVNTITVPFDNEIIEAYAAITGYDPNTGANDHGAVEIDVLNYWRQNGIAGHKIFAYAGLEPSNHSHVQEAVYLFGGCYIGLALPVSAQNQDVWSVPLGGLIGQGAPGSWGGHAVPVVAYDERTLTVVTWGELKQMTWAFWDAYCDESYAIISPDFIVNGKAPNGFDMDALTDDLNAINSNQVGAANAAALVGADPTIPVTFSVTFYGGKGGITFDGADIPGSPITINYDNPAQPNPQTFDVQQTADWHSTVVSGTAPVGGKINLAIQSGGNTIYSHDFESDDNPINAYDITYNAGK